MLVEPTRSVRSSARVFGIGAACGFVAGALVVAADRVEVRRVDRRASSATCRNRAAPSAPTTGWRTSMRPSSKRRSSRRRLRSRPPGQSPRRPPARHPRNEARIPRRRSCRRPPASSATAISRFRSRESARSSSRARSKTGAAALGPTRRSTSWPRATRRSRRSTTAPSRGSSTARPAGSPIYQFDPSERFCYYYAHLERYADGLKEGDRVKKGQVIGYVGISGNAPKNTPHLHFAVFRLTAAKRWWEGTPLDPYDILRRSASNLSGPPDRPSWCRKGACPPPRLVLQTPDDKLWRGLAEARGDFYARRRGSINAAVRHRADVRRA